MSASLPGRRRFLGTALAAGAGVAALPWLARPFSVSWDDTPAAPLAEPTLTIHRGHLDAGTRVRLIFTLDGPGLSVILRDEDMVLGEHGAAVSLPLSYEHPRLVPGRYVYQATVTAVSGDVATGDPLAYTLHRFTFGV